MDTNSVTPSLDEALRTFNRAAAREYAAEGERQRAALLRIFPRGSWPTMALEQYALGQRDSENTFCRWIEFRTTNLGSMLGGSARKLIIYKRREKDGWYFGSQY